MKGKAVCAMELIVPEEDAKKANKAMIAGLCTAVVTFIVLLLLIYPWPGEKQYEIDVPANYHDPYSEQGRGLDQAWTTGEPLLVLKNIREMVLLDPQVSTIVVEITRHNQRIVLHYLGRIDERIFYAKRGVGFKKPHEVVGNPVVVAQQGLLKDQQGLLKVKVSPSSWLWTIIGVVVGISLASFLVGLIVALVLLTINPKEGE